VMGHGQVVAVVGEAGVGKSRLFWEFIESQRSGDALILVSSAASYGKTTPYLPVIDLLKGYFRIDARDDAGKIEARVAAKVLSLGQALAPAPALSPVVALLDTPLEDAQWHGLDPRQKQRRTLEAVKLLLLGESHVHPVIVVLEDLHWVDAETQAMLNALVESVSSHRILLLISYRPEYEHGWGNKSCYTQLRLDPLSPDNAYSLLDNLVGRDETTAELKAGLIDRTGGNPFFLEESVRTLVETGVLVGDRGAYGLTRPSAEIRVPTTVQAVLAARIDRLAPADKTLLQTAAVIGRDVPSILLCAVGDLPEEALRTSLARLQRSEFLHETKLVPEQEYTFKHALTHDVAYQSLLQERRKTMHARVVDAIERLYGDRLAEQAETLARHALQAEIWTKAVEYLRMSGAKAYAKGATLDALARYEQALEALPRLPTHQDNLHVALDVRLDFHLPLFALGHLARLTHLHREAEQLARRLSDQPRLGVISARLAAYSTMNAQYRQGIEYAQEVLDIAAATDDPKLRLIGAFAKGSNHAMLGEYRLAIEFLLRLVEGPDVELAKRLAVGATFAYLGGCGWLAQGLAFVGDFERATTYGDRGILAAEVINQPLAQAYAAVWRAIPSCVKGEFAEAVQLGERAVRLCETKELPGWLPYACYILGWALALSGRLAEGLLYLERGVTLAEGLELGVHFSWSYVLWAEGLLVSGHTERAKGAADRGLEVALAHREQGYETWARYVLGAIAAAGDSPDLEAAFGSYVRAKTLAEALGMRPLAAHCHLGLGKLYGKTGKRQDAQEHLLTATALYREMDMPFWLGQAEAELTR
jgi:tetratricopeptide (TPR) repeat protein